MDRERETDGQKHTDGQADKKKTKGLTDGRQTDL